MKQHLTIIALNTAVLISLLGLWFDGLEKAINQHSFYIEFSMIMLVNMAITIIVYFGYKKLYGTKKQARLITLLLTLSISAYLYAAFAEKILNNRLQNSALRNTAAAKINAVGTGDLFIAAQELTYAEYEQIASYYPVLQDRKLSETAFKISFIHKTG